MSTKLYVGNLSYDATEAGLTQDFSKSGPVRSVKIIIDQMSGRSRGFAFVEMETAEGAQAAIEAFDGKELYGRALKVNIAQERTERPARSFGGGRREGGAGFGGRRDGGGNRDGGGDWGNRGNRGGDRY